MAITSLLEHPDLWRAGRPGGGGVSHRATEKTTEWATKTATEWATKTATEWATKRATEPSHYPLLDQHLIGGGWPVGAVSELCFNQTGIGELQLLAPALAALSRQRRWIAWLNPPFLPYPPALSALGIQVGRMLLVHPATHGDTRPDRPPRGNRQGQTENKPGQTEHRRTLWALEQAGGSGACSAVLAWLNERLLTVRDIQRLQVAARRGNTLIWLFRPEAALNQPSLASLRLRLHAAQSPGADLQRLRIDIVKRLGGWPVDGLVLDLRNSPESVDRRRVMELLTFWRSEHQQPALPDAARPYATSTSVQQRAMH